MTDASDTMSVTRNYWPKGTMGIIATGLTGLVAVLVALKAIAYEPVQDPIIANQDHLFRLIAFAALTVWATFTMGIRRRGTAAVMVLAFASFVELIIFPARGDNMGTVVSANLGIVFAYCGMEMYWMRLVKKRRGK